MSYDIQVVIIAKKNWKEVPTSRRRSAEFVCPTCGAEESLYSHDILSDGRVIPNVTCSMHCGFSGQIKLEGWQ